MNTDAAKTRRAAGRKGPASLPEAAARSLARRLAANGFDPDRLILVTYCHILRMRPRTSIGIGPARAAAAAAGTAGGGNASRRSLREWRLPSSS